MFQEWGGEEKGSSHVIISCTHEGEREEHQDNIRAEGVYIEWEKEAHEGIESSRIFKKIKRI